MLLDEHRIKEFKKLQEGGEEELKNLIKQALEEIFCRHLSEKDIPIIKKVRVEKFHQPSTGRECLVMYVEYDKKGEGKAEYVIKEMKYRNLPGVNTCR